MAENQRPQGREKYVGAGGGKGVRRRGEGLGTGPVGSQQSSLHGSVTGGSGSRPGPRRASGGGRGGLFGIIAAAVILLGGGGGLLGALGGGNSSVDTQGGDTGSALTEIIQSAGDSGGSAYSGASGSGDIGSLLSALLGSGITESAMQTVTQSATVSAGTQAAPSNTQQLDATVASGSRAKRTTILGGGRDQVTVMVYMCGTDLESKYGMGTSDLSEMAAATLSDKLKIAVFTGGCKQWKTTAISSSQNQVYEIASGKIVQRVNNAGTGAMTDPETLSWFIRYCAENYPANRNELILWDHGGGSVSGYGYDEKNSRSGSMGLAGIASALKNGGVTFDFIGFDACLMATVETGLMLDPYADYMIASEETEPGIGWYYTDWVSALSANTSMPTVELGKRIADDFVTTCGSRCRGQSATLSVVDLAELANTAPEALKDFSNSLTAMISEKNYSAISTARSGAREFARSNAIDQIDLTDFAGSVGNAEGQALAEALLGAVKYNRTSSDMRNAYGLSIYFPYRSTGNVSAAVRTYNAIGMDASYGEAIRAFASVEAGGQAVSGGSGVSALGSLLGGFGGSGSGGSYSGGSADLIGGLLGSFLGGGGADFFSDRALTQDETAEYLAENAFDPSYLVWQDRGDGQAVVSMPERQWDLVTGIDINMFYDDGAGFICLGLDNLFSFDENGYLLGETDGTWLAVNGDVVAYYHDYDVYDEDGTMHTYGTIPALLKDETGESRRVELLVVLTHGKGEITGLRYVYPDGETDTVAKSLAEIPEGASIDFIAEYYSYEGEYLDSYRLWDTVTWTGDWEIYNVEIGGAVRATWRFTDIYQQHYWTAPLDFQG
ncbi:MAG: peptidase C11 [Oscillospiraceae bacterium]|nr:peptidase C11 [Oscillospiraceae bacterium]